MRKSTRARPGDRAFVLVHSPLVGPASWSPVADELENRGWMALVPSLLGLAAAAPPRWRHALDQARKATADVAKPLVLVGHSGGGQLLPAIADALGGGVAALVFVDSFLPPASGTVALAPAQLREDLRGLAVAGVLPPWSTWFGPDAMRELVPDESLRADLEAEMPRLPLSCFEESIPVPEGWDGRGCAYVLLSAEPYGGSADEARRRGWRVTEVRGANHLAIATDPIAVTDALLASVGTG